VGLQGGPKLYRFYRAASLQGGLIRERNVQGRRKQLESGGTWRAREREPITGVWGQSPQRGPGAEPLVRGSGGRSPPEADAVLALRHPQEGKNRPICVLRASDI